MSLKFSNAETGFFIPRNKWIPHTATPETLKANFCWWQFPNVRDSWSNGVGKSFPNQHMRNQSGNLKWEKANIECDLKIYIYGYITIFFSHKILEPAAEKRKLWKAFANELWRGFWVVWLTNGMYPHRQKTCELISCSHLGGGVSQLFLKGQVVINVDLATTWPQLQLPNPAVPAQKQSCTVQKWMSVAVLQLNFIYKNKKGDGFGPWATVDWALHERIILSTEA